jgi:hypothetical protein
MYRKFNVTEIFLYSIFFNETKQSQDIVVLNWKRAEAHDYERISLSTLSPRKPDQVTHSLGTANRGARNKMCVGVYTR